MRKELTTKPTNKFPVKTQPNQGVPQKKPGAQELVVLRNRFFYIYYRKISLILLLVLGISLFSLGCAVYFATRKTPPVYIPVSVDGRVIPTYKLSEPSNSDPKLMEAEVKQWGLDAAKKLFLFDYLNYREQITQAQPFFTVRGWEAYVKTFEESQNLNTILASKMIVNFIPMAPPQILDQKNRDGRYTWALEFPAKIKYTAHDGSGKSGFTQKGIMKMVITRVSMIDSPKGIGVDQIIFKEDQLKR